MTRRRLAFLGSILTLACGPASPADGSGGTGQDGTGGSADGSGGATGGAASGGSGGSADTGGAASGGAESGGASTGGSGGATGGESGSTGGGGSVEPGSALERFMDAGEPRIFYLQNVLGDGEDVDTQFNAQMRPADGVCAQTFVGACVLSEDCDMPSYAPSLDAGTITLESPGTPPLVATLVDGDYQAVGDEFLDLAQGGGEPLILAAAGGVDVSAFELETTFPLVVLIDSPAGDLTAPIPVPTTQDLTLEFRRASGNVVLLIMAAAGTGDTARRIECAGSGDPGMLVVPAEALAYLGPGIEMTVYTASIETIDAGDWSVTFNMLTGTSNDERQDLFKLVTE